MNKIEWSEPPKARGGRTSRYEWFYDGLKDKPGVWAKYPGTAGGATGYVDRHPDFEVTTRVVAEGEDSEQKAWMRYAPEDADVGVEFESADA